MTSSFHRRLIPLCMLLALCSGCGRRKCQPVSSVTLTKSEDPFERTTELSTHVLFVEDIPTLEVTDTHDSNAFNPAEVSPREMTELEQQEQVSFDLARARADELPAFKRVYFDFDSYEIRPDQEETVRLNIEQARAAVSKGATIVIEGHACSSAGSGTYNLMISEKRAQSIAKAFMEAGIPSVSLKIVGRGYEMPLVVGGDRVQQAPNRRVEMYELQK